jgi:microcystin-dependent protein
MAINYNSVRSLKGTAIGTIVPWVGDIGKIPKGWLRCDGTEKQVTDFPLLYDIIGIRYGGTTGLSFSLPSLQGKGLVDYHTSHQNIPGISMPNTFKNLINDTNDVPNSLQPSAQSTVDLKATLSPVNNIKGTISAQTLNEPSYFDSVYIAGRLLGDDHIASHGHVGTFTTVSTPSSWVEDCENNSNANGFLCCADSCGGITTYEVEANTAGRQALLVGAPEGGVSLLYGQAASTTVDFAQSDSFGTFSLRNYISPGDDPLSSNNGGYPYNVTLDQNTVNFVNTGSLYHTSHDHQSLQYSITKGSMAIPASYSINNISTGNCNPVNAPQQGIGVIEVEPDTPVCQVMHIIRAY